MRKQRLEQVILEEAEDIRQVAQDIDYDVMGRIVDILKSVKKNRR